MSLPKKKRRTSNIGRLGLECHFLKYTDKKKFVEYQIKLKCLANQETWNVLKRYNDFYHLNNELLKDRNFRGIKLPTLPPKKITLTGSSTKEVAEERKDKLQDYLNGVITRTIFLSSKSIQAFLSMPSSVRNLTNILNQRQNSSLKEGYMYKKGAYNKKWKKRYFILQPNYILKYYKEESSNEPQGSIDISTIMHVSSKCEDSEKKYTFSLKSCNRTWKLACINESDKREWTRMFMRLKDTKAPPKLGKFNNEKDKFHKQKSINISNQHFGSVTSILWSPVIPGILATGSNDETVKIWHTQLIDNTLIAPEYDEILINKMLSNDNIDNNDDDNDNDIQNDIQNNIDKDTEIENKKGDDNKTYGDSKTDGDNKIFNKPQSTFPLHAIEFSPIAEYKTSGKVTCLRWSPDGTIIVVSLTRDSGNFDDKQNRVLEYFIQTFDLSPILGIYDDDDDNNSYDSSKSKEIMKGNDNQLNGNINGSKFSSDDDNQKGKIFTLQDHPSQLLFSHDGNCIYMSMNIDPNSDENEKRRPAFLVYLNLTQNQLHRCKTVDRIIDHQTEFIVCLTMNNNKNVMCVATSTHHNKGRLLAWDILKNETKIVERKGIRISSMKFTEDDSWLIIGRANGNIEFWNVYNANNKKLKKYLNKSKKSISFKQKNKDNNTKGDDTIDGNKHEFDEVEIEKAPNISVFEKKYTKSDSHTGTVFNLSCSNGILISSSKPTNLGYESFYCRHILWDLRNLMNYGHQPKLITKLHNINDNEKDITRLLDLSPTTSRHVREGGGPGTLLAASGDQSIYCHNLIDVLLDAINL